MNAGAYRPRLLTPGRARVRRRRPPSRWLFAAAWTALSLGWVGLCAVRFAAGDPLEALPAAIFAIAFVTWRSAILRAERMEHAGIVLPPPAPLDWLILAIQVAVFIADCTL